MQNLYDQLLELTTTSEAFYFKDYILPQDPGYIYRVFNYRLASYTDFLQPGALESRGTTFILNEKQNYVGLVSRPWKKFFNLNENPFTMGLNLNTDNIKHVATKADGSLISTFCNPITGYFGVKSKQDFFSSQSFLARDFLQNRKNIELWEELHELALWGYTVIMELVSPLNRIVLPYDTTDIIILGVRDNTTGKRYDKDSSALEGFPNVISKWVDEDFSKEESFINSVKTMENIEGFVVTLKDGLMFKCKTDWYVILHHLKDSVSSTRRLFEAVILETTDDLKEMFHDDKGQLDRISSMEQKVIPVYNHMISLVERFYKENKELDRKSYAIKGQQELGQLFNLAMSLYLGRLTQDQYKDFAIKYRKEYFEIEETIEDVLMGE